MEKHAIPQNIMDIEFKLFGSMTVKQFGTVAISFVLAFLIYVLGLPEIVSYPIIFFTVVIGLALAFVKVNGMPFTTYFNNFLTSLMTSQRKVYRKTSSSEKKSEDTPVPVRPSAVEPKLVKRVARPDLAGFTQRADQIDSQLEDPLAENKVQSLDAYFSGEAAKSLGKYGIAAGNPATTSNASALPSLSDSVGTPASSTQALSAQYAAAQTLPSQTVASQAVPQQTSNAVQISELTPPRVPGNYQPSVTPVTSSESISRKETITASGLRIVQKDSQLGDVVPMVQSRAANDVLQPAVDLPQPRTVENDLPVVPVVAPPTPSPELPVVAQETEQKERIQDLLSAANLDTVIATTPVSTQATTLKPNQVAGFITDAASQPLAQVQVIVKDKLGNLLRAAYTDNKGKFLISSALPSGSYELEFIKIGYTFLPHQLELTGTRYPIYKYTAQT